MRSIVITPTYNEADNISPIIEAVLDLSSMDHLIVDDNSPDGTADIVDSYCERSNRVHLIRRTGPKGFGPSYVDGFRYAIEHGYDAIFSMDADFSHNPADLPALENALWDYDVAVGSRYVDGKVSVINWPMSRLFLSTFAGKYVRSITRLNIWDPTSGFKGFRANVLKSIDLDSLRSNGYCFQVETLFRVKRCGFRIGEVPIVFTERREGQSKMSKKIIFEAVIMPWRLRLRPYRPNQ